MQDFLIIVGIGLVHFLLIDTAISWFVNLVASNYPDKETRQVLRQFVRPLISMIVIMGIGTFAIHMTGLSGLEMIFSYIYFAWIVYRVWMLAIEPSTVPSDVDSLEQIDSLATEILQMIDQMLIDHKLIGTIIATYTGICRGTEDQRLGISEKPITEETHLRIRFECLCYCVSVASILALIHLKDNKKYSISSNFQDYNPFDGAIGVAFLELCERTGMDSLREITVSLDFSKSTDAGRSEMLIGFGDYIDPLDRLNEYRTAFLRMENETTQNSPVEIFGKRIGKVLDAEHYVLLDLIGIKTGSQLREITEIAFKRCLKAAEQGDADAQFNLGVMYEQGNGVKKDYTQAAKWYRKAAEQGHADAQFNLGSMYANGEGVKQDDTQAVEWFRKAAEQGHAYAQNNLGLMYAKGEGVKQDYTQAVEWYRKAAEQGYDKAQFNLGVIYANGHGVKKD